jgi:deferrochelatase/peroxidase EfeB
MLAAAAAGMTVGGCTAAPAHPPAPARPERQPGIVTPPPGFLALVALDVTAAGPAAPLASLADRISRVHGAGAATVTLAVGASLFDERFGLSGLRPAGLAAMPSFPSDVLDAGRCHGDLLLQVCADRAEEATTVADDLVAAAAGAVRIRWRTNGFRPENTVTPAGRPSTRNLFGFREGAGNPDPGDDALMERLVWAGGGTYQVVRLIRFAVGLWNRDPVTRQEEMIGRHRADGTPLAGGAEDADFSYAGDPDGQVTPLDAHIRRANPRTADSREHRILRRGYSYGAGADQGLIFICFQRDIEAGFATVQRRLDGETLQRYVLPFGGGYYFVPPSVAALHAAVLTKG